jgi:hypothetical protein
VLGKLEVVCLPVQSLPESIIDLRPGADDEEGGPEDAYREFLIASLSGDRDRLLRRIMMYEDPAVLWQGAYPEDVAAALANHYRTMHVRVPQPSPPVFLTSDGFFFPLAVVQEGSRWVIDPDPLIRARREVGGR